MSTDEREITEPVLLALPDGMHLNPEATGWSRRVLHTGNLAGVWGRTKRWDYWAVLAGDLVVSSVYADVDYLGLADVWWCDLPSGRSGGRGITAPFARGIALPDLPGSAPLRARSRNLDLQISDAPDGTTRIEATWRERDGRPGTLDVAIELPAGHESMNVVIPWSDRRFQYTSKHQARPASGRLTVGDEGRPALAQVGVERRPIGLAQVLPGGGNRVVGSLVGAEHDRPMRGGESHPAWAQAFRGGAVHTGMGFPARSALPGPPVETHGNARLCNVNRSGKRV